MIIQWFEIPCPHCEKCNWVSNGDIEDISYPDIEAVECYNCGCAFWIETQEELSAEEKRPMMTEKGAKQPEIPDD